MNNTYNDIVNVIEGGEGDEWEQACAMQRQINSGAIWRMQGSMGRAAMDALKSGSVMLGEDRHTDAYGNVIPSRDDVKQGTRGSYDFVVKANGIGWARDLTKLP